MQTAFYTHDSTFELLPSLSVTKVESPHVHHREPFTEYVILLSWLLYSLEISFIVNHNN